MPHVRPGVWTVGSADGLENTQSRLKDRIQTRCLIGHEIGHDVLAQDLMRAGPWHTRLTQLLEETRSDEGLQFNIFAYRGSRNGSVVTLNLTINWYW